jgi:adenine deaminase
MQSRYLIPGLLDMHVHLRAAMLGRVANKKA